MGGAHASHEVHANSLLAFAELDVSKREALVLSAYLLARAPMTDRDCATRLGIVDLNGVRPRVTALIDRALLWEVGSVKCEVTGRTVRICTPTSLARAASA